MLLLRFIFWCFGIFSLFYISTGIVTAGNSADTERNTNSEYIDPLTGMEFVLINGGCFEMGDTTGHGEIDEMPVHDVCVNDFFMGKYEVTNEQFMKFILETGYKTSAERFGQGYGISKEGLADRGLKDGIDWKHPLWPSDSIMKKMAHPVVQISHEDATIFSRWLSRKTGMKCRLPTEAEWEYAARNCTKEYEYSWGSNKPADNIADESMKKFRKYKYWKIWDGYNDGYVYTSPVGKFNPTELGLFDISGNVSEWCSDWYDSYYYERKMKDNPQGAPDGVERSLRGGSWNFKPVYLRSANRMAIFPNNWSYYIGFRLVMEPEEL